MKLPFISRKQYESDIATLNKRILDLERHFVTKRNDKGEVTETLADVPVEKRVPSRPLRSISWPQRRAFLEQESAAKAGVRVP